MSLVGPVLDRLRARVHRVLRTPGEMARLMGRDDPTLKAISDALSAAWRRAPSQEERIWFGKIESLRRQLLESSDEVSLTDYGAGTGDAALSDGEMHRGRQVRRRVGDICRTAAKPRAWATLLFYLVKNLRPETCLELGSSLGISAAYQAAALELNDAGRLVSIEGAEAIAALARRHLGGLKLSRATVEVGRFQDRLEGVLRDLGRVDFAFIDGHHDEHATVGYFEKVRPSLADRAVVVFDDIAWSAGMRRAWQRIRADAGVQASLDLFKIGLVVTGVRRAPAEHFRIAFA